jgi:hypothetical protein
MRLHRILVVAGAVSLLTGCAGLTASQKGAIAEFSRATAAVGETTKAELTEMRERMIRTNESRLILRGPLPSLAAASTLDGNLTVANVSVVANAAAALQSYGEMLQALVEDTQESELHSAAAKFATSVRSVPNVKLSADASDAISSVIVFTGRRLIEAKKAHAIKTIVPATKPAIDTICDTLTRDFDFRQAGLAADLHAATEALHGAASVAFQDVPAAGDAAATQAAVSARAFSLPALQYAVQGRLRRDEILSRIATSATAIKRANAALADALAHDRLTLEDVKGAVGETGDLKPAFAELSKQASDLVDRSNILSPARAR